MELSLAYRERFDGEGPSSGQANTILYTRWFVAGTALIAVRICFSEASKICAMAASSVSGPYFSTSPLRLRSPIVTAPTWQLRSPSTRNGRCTLARMVSSRLLFFLPAMYSLAGGMRMHSSQILRAPGL